MRPDLPPWLYPPARMPRFSFNSGAVAFTAGVEQFLGRIRTAPGLWLRLALVSVSSFGQDADARLRLAGPACGDWSGVTWLALSANTWPVELPIFLILPQHSEAEVFFTPQQSTTRVVRLLGWHFDPDLRG